MFEEAFHLPLLQSPNCQSVFLPVNGGFIMLHHSLCNTQITVFSSADEAFNLRYEDYTWDCVSWLLHLHLWRWKTVNLQINRDFWRLCPSDGSRVVQMDDGFFVGYRKTAACPQEVLLSVNIPYSKRVSTAPPSQWPQSVTKLQLKTFSIGRQSHSKHSQSSEQTWSKTPRCGLWTCSIHPATWNYQLNQWIYQIKPVNLPDKTSEFTS